MTSFSKQFSRLANYVLYFCLSRDSNPSRFVNLSLFFFVYFIFNAQKVEIKIEKQIHMHLNFIVPKMKLFRGFRVFVLSPIPKTRTRKSRKFHKNAIILKYESVSSEAVKMFSKSHKSQCDLAIFPIRYRVFVF